MKYSLGISNFLEEISSLSHFIVFLYLFALITKDQLISASLVAQMVKRVPAMQETRVWPLGWEDPLEKEMATQSSILAWKIPWTEELIDYSPWGHKESDTTERLHFLFFSLLSLTSFHFSVICKTSSDSHFAFLHFFFLGVVLIPVSCTMSWTS